MSDERRLEPRYEVPPAVLSVTDRAEQRPLGHVSNLSRQGFMLVTDSSLPDGGVYQIDLGTGDMLPDISAIPCGITILWSSPASTPGSHFYGCQIIDITDSADLQLKDLIEVLELM